MIAAAKREKETWLDPLTQATQERAAIPADKRLANTPSPLRLTVPLGTMENRPRLSDAESGSIDKPGGVLVPLQASSSGGLRYSRRSGTGRDSTAGHPS